MRSNGLLKWLMVPVALLVLFVAIRLFSGGSSSAPPAADAGAKLTPAEMKALGIEGDTPRDTVATLVAQMGAPFLLISLIMVLLWVARVQQRSWLLLLGVSITGGAAVFASQYLWAAPLMDGVRVFCSSLVALDW